MSRAGQNCDHALLFTSLLLLSKAFLSIPSFYTQKLSIDYSTTIETLMAARYMKIRRNVNSDSKGLMLKSSWQAESI
eukprot:m.4065 g.4065  ORF g.4065 m.4065 type:complete len:77 (+) comp6681_c0_seq2:353-583(+)